VTNHFSTPGVLLGTLLALGGCTTLPTQKMAPDEEAVIVGPAPRANVTPIDHSLACLAQTLREWKAPVVGLAVGDVKDYTGKFSQNEGSAITQGGALMVYSALGKLGETVRLHERFDTRIAELELAYTDRRQLGDGRPHDVEAGKPPVPWVPYFGGSILRSDYYIVGGITELNYNIASGGYEAGVAGASAKSRTFTMNVGVDLRIVDTRTLAVVKTVSLEKHIVGEEIGAGLFRFFGKELVDINVGSKKQEPLQLGVRTALEQGVIELVAAVTRVDASGCAGSRPQAVAAVAPVARALPASAPAAAPAPQGTQSGLPPQNLTGAAAGRQLVTFDLNSSTIAPPALGVIDSLAQEAGAGRNFTLQLLARETEQLPPQQLADLVDQRVRAVTDALAAKGVTAGRVRVSWRTDRIDASVPRIGNGFVAVATLVIGS
jgi:curli biogenesis system outer membrane secretion channel CsgG